MAFGCLASLVLYVTVGLVFLQPALLPPFWLLVLVLIVARVVSSDPDRPVY